MPSQDGKRALLEQGKCTGVCASRKPEYAFWAFNMYGHSKLKWRAAVRGCHPGQREAHRALSVAGVCRCARTHEQTHTHTHAHTHTRTHASRKLVGFPHVSSYNKRCKARAGWPPCECCAVLLRAYGLLFPSRRICRSPPSRDPIYTRLPMPLHPNIAFGFLFCYSGCPMIASQ